MSAKARLRKYPQHLMQVMLPKGKDESSVFLDRAFIPKAKRTGMTISVNDQPVTVAASCSVLGLVTQLFSERQKGIAVSVNQHVIPKSGWEQHQLQPGDSILIIRATQGG